MLVEIFHNGDDNKDYYFAGCTEIKKPVKLTTAVTLSDGTIIVAISEVPKRHLFKEKDIVNITLEDVIDPPKWLLELS